MFNKKKKNNMITFDKCIYNKLDVIYLEFHFFY